MAKKGLKRSKLFSWKRAVDIMVEQFKKCPKNSNRTSFILKDYDCFNSQMQTMKITFKLFGFFPLLKVKKNIELYKLSMFNLLPLYSCKHVGGRKQWKIFGFPIFKIRRMANGITTKYYVLGFPIMKVSRKLW